MLEDHVDLREILDDALVQVGGDSRKVWYWPAIGFDTHAERRNALLLGGVHSPAYLVKESDWETGGVWKLPYVFTLGRTRILPAGPLDGELEPWIAFLEDLANAKDSLVIVTPAVENDMLLKTFLVNTHRKSLTVCPIHPGAIQPEELAEQLGATRKSGMFGNAQHAVYLESGTAPEDDLRKHLAQVEQVMGRRNAAVAFLDSQPELSKLCSEIVVIHLGGNHYQDQMDRLLAMAQAVGELAASPKRQ